MDKGTWFWVLLVLSVVFSGWVNYPFNAQTGRVFGSSLLLVVLLAILGWAAFGAPIR